MITAARRPGRFGLQSRRRTCPDRGAAHRAARLSEPHPRQRPSGLFDPRHLDLERVGPGLVRRRIEGRSARPLGLRAHVRASDVQVDPQPGARADGPADRGCRRLQQRLDQRRLHQLLRGGPGQPSPAAALGRGRADGLAGRRAGLLRLRARRGEGGVALSPSRPALRQAFPLSTRRSPTTCIPTPGPASATSRSWTRRRSTTCAPSTPPITGPTMRCWSSPAISTRPSSTRWIDQYFAPIARPAAADPARHGDRAGAHRGARATPSTRPNTPLPAVLITYPLPPTATATRRRSRCSTRSFRPARARGSTRALVYRDQLASEAARASSS